MVTRLSQALEYDSQVQNATTKTGVQQSLICVTVFDGFSVPNRVILLTGEDAHWCCFIAPIYRRQFSERCFMPRVQAGLWPLIIVMHMRRDAAMWR